MHAGRVSHPDITGGIAPVGPSPIAVEGETRTYQDKQPFVVPHTLTAEEIPGVVEEFVGAVRNAVAAGLDEVEIHGANGYLLHQFLDAETNQRTDNWGGTPEHRARLTVQVTTAVAAAIGAERVGLRISLGHQLQGIDEIDPVDVADTYTAVVEALAPLGLAYLSILHHDPAGELVQDLRRHRLHRLPRPGQLTPTPGGPAPGRPARTDRPGVRPPPRKDPSYGRFSTRRR